MAVGFQHQMQEQIAVTRSYNVKCYTASCTKQVQFGDGYEQRIQDGINNLKQEFSVTFNNRPKLR